MSVTVKLGTTFSCTLPPGGSISSSDSSVVAVSMSGDEITVEAVGVGSCSVYGYDGQGKATSATVNVIL